MRIEANGRDKGHVMAYGVTVPQMEGMMSRNWSHTEIAKEIGASELTVIRMQGQIRAERERETEDVILRATKDALIFALKSTLDHSVGDGARHHESLIEMRPSRRAALNQKAQPSGPSCSSGGNTRTARTWTPCGLHGSP